MANVELAKIGEAVRTLPVFEDFDTNQLTKVAADCAELLAEDDGLDAVLGIIEQALPKRLRETAYVLACDVAAADRTADQEELRLLEMLRHQLEVGRLPAAAIERSARARYAVRREARPSPRRRHRSRYRSARLPEDCGRDGPGRDPSRRCEPADRCGRSRRRGSLDQTD